MNTFLFYAQSESNLNSPTDKVTPQLSYFDIISNRLDSWEASQQAIKLAKAQTKKSFILNDEDSLIGITKTYKLTIELLSTTQAPTVDDGEMEESYVS